MTTIIKLLQQFIMATEKVKKKKASPRTQEQAAEFGRAGRAVRLVRTAFYPLLKDLNDLHQSARLMTKLHEAIKGDPIHGRGKRTATAGDLTYLEGFDFNAKQQLARVFMTRFEAAIDRKTGQCMLHIPAFTPSQAISYEGNITHVEITAMAAMLDFERESIVADMATSELCAIKQRATILLQPAVTPHSKLPILLAMRLRFYQVVNGQPYLIGGAGKTVLNIVKAENALRPTPTTKRT
jgi:hypothetical protein